MASSADVPRFLLLLPPLPSGDFASLKSGIFGDTVTQVLKEAAQQAAESPKAVILDVALACSDLAGKHMTSRASLFPTVSAQLSTIYRLFGVLAAQDGINIEDSDGIDVRVLLVAWSPEGNEHIPISYGPVTSLQSLAGSGRPWQFAFGVEDDDGTQFVRAFVAAKSQAGKANPVPASRAQVVERHSQSHHHVLVGGTFDHLHIGHKLLLTMTLFAVDDSSNKQLDRTATIGITGEQLLVNKKHAHVLESWEQRQANVAQFVDAIVNFTTDSPQVTRQNQPGPNGKTVHIRYPNGLTVNCTEIWDPYGPSITEERISALVISAETRAGGNAVNDKRLEKAWQPLDVLEVQVLDVDDDDNNENAELRSGFEGKISSTAIREKIAQRQSSG